MKKTKITINGVEYPFRQTMGSMVRFKQMQGIEVAEIKEGDTENLCAYFYCIIKSACNADGVEFKDDFLSFCDKLTAEDIAEMTRQFEEGNEEKKTENL